MTPRCCLSFNFAVQLQIPSSASLCKNKQCQSRYISPVAKREGEREGRKKRGREGRGKGRGKECGGEGGRGRVKDGGWRRAWICITRWAAEE
ncbi:MAG: hypothetical protein ACK55Z_27675, partial [bacterium]